VQRRHYRCSEAQLPRLPLGLVKELPVALLLVLSLKGRHAIDERIESLLGHIIADHPEAYSDLVFERRDLQLFPIARFGHADIP
jgi:hypothetical protein